MIALGGGQRDCRARWIAPGGDGMGPRAPYDEGAKRWP